MFIKISHVISALLIGGILLGSASFPTGVRADSIITVTTTDDELNSDGDCSLREAIQAANTDSAVDACSAGSGADTITVPAGIYTLTITGTGEDANATGDLDITDSVTINGAGQVNTIIQAGTDSTNGIDRVLHIVSASTVNITGVTIANGMCAGSPCHGGGINKEIGTLTIANSKILYNSATRGGGIYTNDGTLNVRGSTFLHNSNSGSYMGTSIFNGGTLNVNNSTFSNNYGMNYSQIYNSGTATVKNSLFSDNFSYYGGAIYNKNNATLTVTECTFANNGAYEGGGIMNNGTLSVTNSTFANNSAYARGGGGIMNNGTLSVTNSTFSNNHSLNGGGILNDGSLTVTNSTFSNNRNFAGAVTGVGKGGGILNTGTLVVVNSTFSGNTCKDKGGGIYNYRTLTVLNTTFSGNASTHTSLGGGIYNDGTLKLNNSILANSTSGADCYNDLGAVSGTNNLIETDAAGANTCGTTAPIHSDPNLGPLDDNGSSTQTFALLPGSPAIDTGDDSICATAPVNNTSQNGITRPQGVHCDIGSFEVPITSPLTLLSVGANDGWILESTETSGQGGTMNVNGQAIVLGDDAADKQFRSILHFNTAALPDNAVITKVTLLIKKKAVVGTDPFTTHLYIKVGIRSGGFGNNTALQLTDFQSAASKNWIGTIKNTPVGDWYSAVLNKLAFPFVNLTSATQFRLSFALDDDNDNLADYIQFFSGNAAVADRPQLIVEYYTP